MSTYEVLTLLFLFGSFLIALLAYLDRDNKREPPPLSLTLRSGGFVRSVAIKFPPE